MSVLNRFLQGWEFRSATPSFEAGEEITAYMTGYMPEQNIGVVRIGDSILTIPEAELENVDTLLRLEITSFDEARYHGKARIVDSSEAQ